MASRWPKDNQNDLINFYGNPATSVAAQLVKVIPPFKMYYQGREVTALSFHKKAAPALLSALNKIWDYYGQDQAEIDRLRISSYAGTYNQRKISNSDKWSNHAFGAAIDLDAEHNGFNTGKGTIPIPVVAAFKSEGAAWGGDYRNRTDPMHFEFCDRGEPQRSFEQWLTALGAPLPGNPPAPPIPPVTATSRPILQFGSAGPDVAYLQRMLGAPPGFVGKWDDGDFGPKTLDRVKAFQARAGLSQSGVVDQPAWEALEE